MTVHAAKGLEFPVVFVTGLEDGVFPPPAARRRLRLEEERRLAYVAITRAREQLYLSHVRRRRLFGQELPGHAEPVPPQSAAIASTPSSWPVQPEYIDSDAASGSGPWGGRWSRDEEPAFARGTGGANSRGPGFGTRRP